MSPHLVLCSEQVLEPGEILPPSVLVLVFQGMSPSHQSRGNTALLVLTFRVLSSELFDALHVSLTQTSNSVSRRQVYFDTGTGKASS